MRTEHGVTEPGSDHHLLEHQLDALKTSVRKLLERVGAKPGSVPTRLRAFAGRATETIKDHPFAAVAGIMFAVGAGYMVVRMVRR